MRSFTSSDEKSNFSTSKSSRICCSFVVPVRGVMPFDCAILNNTCAGVHPTNSAISCKYGCASSEGDPVSVQNDLRSSQLPPSPRPQRAHLLILNPPLLAIAYHLPIEPNPLIPPVLHDLRPPPRVLERLQNRDIVHITDPDAPDVPRVLQRHDTTGKSRRRVIYLR